MGRLTHGIFLSSRQTVPPSSFFIIPFHIQRPLPAGTLMTSADTPEEHLDFTAPAAATAGPPACTSCAKPIDTEYWSVGTAVICSACRANVSLEQGDAAKISRRGSRFSKALLYGVGGMIAGAAIWYGVAKFLNLEIGLIAILLGWLVGKGVMKGSDERGGRRYQVMAVLLTWYGIGLGYFPFMIENAQEQSSATAAVSSDSMTTEAPVSSGETAESPIEAPATGDSDLGFFGAVGTLLLMTAALPWYAVSGGFPGSLISILIYGFALLQAWRMTASRELVISGPFKVGTAGAA